VHASAVDFVSADIERPSVFFFDRPSRGAINLANTYAAAGSLVVFEPSANAEPALFEAALETADIVKYSDQRLAAIPPSRVRKRRVEIQTLGASGLRYRTAQGRSGSWQQLPAIAAPRVVDTAGAGDWCTAGLLTRIGGGGRAALDDTTNVELRDALRYGQALSAWNCRFEGARGGMYEQSPAAFKQEIEALLAGAERSPMTDASEQDEFELNTICPACPSDAPRGALRSRVRGDRSAPSSK